MSIVQQALPVCYEMINDWKPPIDWGEFFRVWAGDAFVWSLVLGILVAIFWGCRFAALAYKEELWKFEEVDSTEDTGH